MSVKFELEFHRFLGMNFSLFVNCIDNFFICPILLHRQDKAFRGVKTIQICKQGPNVIQEKELIRRKFLKANEKEQADQTMKGIYVILSNIWKGTAFLYQGVTICDT